MTQQFFFFLKCGIDKDCLLGFRFIGRLERSMAWSTQKMRYCSGTDGLMSNRGANRG